MKKWEISSDGWYPYCPECKQESYFRTPVCMKCGALLIPNDDDMDLLRRKSPPMYAEVMSKYIESGGRVDDSL